METIVWFGFVLSALSAAGKVVVTRPQEKITLQCGVTDYNKMTWRHGNDLIYEDVKSRHPGRNYPVKGSVDTAQRSRLSGTSLIISNIKNEDSGKFTCVTDGKSHEHTLLVVSVSASSSGELPLGSSVSLHCQVNGLDSPVQWKRPNDGALVSSATVKLESVSSPDEGTWMCLFSYGGVNFNHSLNVKVKRPAPTKHAPGVLEPTTTNSLPGVTSDAPLLLGPVWWVWVAVAVAGCLVLIFLLVFVVILCKRIKRRKRKLQKMKQLKPFCQCNRPTAAAKPLHGSRREKPSDTPLQPLLMERHERQIGERRDTQEGRKRERRGRGGEERIEIKRGRE